MSFRNKSVLFIFLDGKVLIFVTQKVNSAELAKNVQENGFKGLFIRYFYLGQQLYWQNLIF